MIKSTTTAKAQQVPGKTSEKADWPRPRGFAAAAAPARSASFGYPSVRRPDAPPSDAERMAAEDVERWDGLS
jgi:hypothetical protein